MRITETNTKLNIEGANKKKLVRVDSKLAVEKDTIQENTSDNVTEWMYTVLAEYFGIACCEVLLTDDTIVSIFEDNWMSMVELCDYIKLSSCNVTKLFDQLESMGTGKDVLNELANILLFDVIVRQLDRNLTNIAVILDDAEQVSSWYPQYDNGLCLFSTTPTNGNVVYQTVLGSSELVIETCLNYDCSKVMSKELTVDIISEIWDDMPEVLSNGNKLVDIVNWVSNEFEYVGRKYRLHDKCVCCGSKLLSTGECSNMLCMLNK